MVLFSLPGILEFRKLNIWFLELFNKERNFFYNEAIIDNIYGSMPGIIWNGGRNSPIIELPINDVINVFDSYKKYCVNLRFTFTNMLLRKEHLKDSYSNQILKLISDYGYEITINSQVLEKYIRFYYPQIALISSTTKCITSLETLNAELGKDYKLVVLDFRKNSDRVFLSSIQKREKIEILLNEDCLNTCTQRERHYKDISKNILMYDKMPDTEYYCKGKCDDLYDSFKQETTIKVEDVYGIYLDMGYNHVKLRGRRSDYFDVLESYIYYLIKPKYRDIIRLKALKNNLYEGVF